MGCGSLDRETMFSPVERKVPVKSTFEKDRQMTSRLSFQHHMSRISGADGSRDLLLVDIESPQPDELSPFLVSSAELHGIRIQLTKTVMKLAMAEAVGTRDMFLDLLFMCEATLFMTRDDQEVHAM